MQRDKVNRSSYDIKDVRFMTWIVDQRLGNKHVINIGKLIVIKSTS